LPPVSETSTGGIESRTAIAYWRPPKLGPRRIAG
jgi:hypothetical protein